MGCCSKQIQIEKAINLNFNEQKIKRKHVYIRCSCVKVIDPDQ